jgi:hypothetical protein
MMQIKDLELENLLELLKKYELSELTVQDGRYMIALKRNVQQLPYISRQRAIRPFRFRGRKQMPTASR